MQHKHAEWALGSTAYLSIASAPLQSATKQIKFSTLSSCLCKFNFHKVINAAPKQTVLLCRNVCIYEQNAFLNAA